VAYGLSPKLPLLKDPADGYALNKTYREMVAQNLKMVVLTAPGERMMEPNFGVGLRNYLFKNNTQQTYHEIESKIREQVSFYLPFVTIIEVKIEDYLKEIGITSNGVKISLQYNINPISVIDSLEIKASAN
jgi:phage baseplate assembly protein W